MTRKSYMEYHKQCCEKMVKITEAKNHDYAGGGDDAFKNFRQIASLIGDQDGNQRGTGPVDIIAVGFLTRMSDKFSRIGSFVSEGNLLVKNESVEDTLMDLANYCILFS